MNDLSVVIITYNNAGQIKSCLNALVHSSSIPDEILIIDNASVDDTRKIVRSFPHTRTISNSSNIGFAAACNQGISETKGKYVCFLNPDTFSHPDALSILHNALDLAKENIAGVGPKLIRSKQGQGGQNVIDSAGMALSSSHLSPYDRGQGEYDQGQYDSGKGYLGPSCACALFRRKALIDLEIDGEIFDEDFFAYYEDVDLAWRARLLGWSFQFVPEALVVHDRKNPQAHKTAVQARAFVNRYFCAIKNDPDCSRYIGSAIFESIRFSLNLLSRPGFSPALPHLLNNLGHMIQKREMLKKRRKIDSIALKEFE